MRQIKTILYKLTIILTLLAGSTVGDWTGVMLSIFLTNKIVKKIYERIDLQTKKIWRWSRDLIKIKNILKILLKYPFLSCSALALTVGPFEGNWASKIWFNLCSLSFLFSLESSLCSLWSKSDENYRGPTIRVRQKGSKKIVLMNWNII